MSGVEFNGGSQFWNEKGVTALKRILLTGNSDSQGQVYINQDYLFSVMRAGGMPLLLPLLTTQEEWDEALSFADGVIITGGADVDPESYGAEKQLYCGTTDLKRDQMEIGLCHTAIRMDKPLLCICRGEQILNCALGGTLYQDISMEFSNQMFHPQYARKSDQVHEVVTEAGSRLAEITGKERFLVNSRHHQAVWKLGEGLKVSAYAPDGLIEGIELPDKRFAIGVQWHPESLSSYAPEAAAIFSAFIKAC